MKNRRLGFHMVLGLLLLPSLVKAEDSSSEGYNRLFRNYESIRVALLADSMGGVARHARALEEQASSLRQSLSDELAVGSRHDVEGYRRALEEIEASALKLVDLTDLDAVREEFFLLTQPMARYRRLAGDKNTVVAYCSMAQKAWIQPAGEIGNPYYGKEMPKCGEVVGEID